MATTPQIPNTDRIVSYSPVGSTSAFIVPWVVVADSEILAEDDLVVIVNGVTFNSTQFSFAGNVVVGLSGIWNGGTVTLTTAVSGVRVIIYSKRNPRRTGNFLEGNALPFTTLDKLTDDVVVQIRDLALRVARSFKTSALNYYDNGDAEMTFSAGTLEAVVAAYLAGITPATAVAGWARTLAAAKALYAAPVVLSDGHTVSVACKTANGDGYAGIFSYRLGDVATTFSQDGMGFVDNQNRRFFRVGIFQVNAQWFGAKGDGTGNSGTDTNYTTQLQAALDTAWAANLDCFIPAGVYLTTGLTQPGNAAGRTKAFRIYGQGSGEIFARPFTGGTILYSVTNAPILQYTPDVANTGGGNIDIDHIRFEGLSATPVVYLKSFYAQSRFHHNAIFQGGTGDGFKSELSNTIEIDNNYAINADWNSTGLNAARTGIGFYILQTIPTGLTTLRKNTSRGFKYGYKMGDATANSVYSPRIADCECSRNFTGIWLTSSAEGALVDNCYMEGGETGSGVQDEGNYNCVRDTTIFSGFGTGIDSQADTYGSVYEGNTISAGSVANSKLLKINSNAAFGGPGKSATANAFTFSGSGGAIAGVIALVITGIDPRLDLSGNVFNPRGAWTGGAGTAKISNQSTSSDGTTGTGNYGLGIAVSKDNSLECVQLGRGALNLAVDQTALVDANVAANVLTIGELSVFTLTPTGPVTINQIAAGNLPDKLISIHCTNGNTTWQQNTKMKLSGSANFTPGANGSWHVFQIKPTGVAYEISRIAY